MAGFDPIRVKRALDDFGEAVINQARENLSQRGNPAYGGDMNASYQPE
jgi:hypothetical protein